MIVGDIDTGITPQHPSFADHAAGNYVGNDYGPPPARRKGTGDPGPNDPDFRYRFVLVGFSTHNPSTYDWTTWLRKDPTGDDEAGGPAIAVGGDPFTAAIGATVQPTLQWARDPRTQGTAFNPIGSSFNLLSWDAPVSSDPVTLEFQQSIGRNEALRTGTYAKTLTFTLSTTTP